MSVVSAPASTSIVVPNALCIPRIECSILKSQIFATFCKLKIGTIESVVEIPFKDMPRYKRIIVKLKWNDSDCAKFMLSRFREDKNVKIVYNPPLPWFWICVPNRLHCKLDDATTTSFPSTSSPSTTSFPTTSLPLAPSLSGTRFHVASSPGPVDGYRPKDDDEAFPPLRPLAPAFLPTSLPPPPPDQRPFQTPTPPPPLPSTLPIAAGLDGYGIERDHYICSGNTPHEYKYEMQIWNELTKS